ncbi:MAG: DUF1462 family protein [Actinomycetota bacterium]|nr:DUF1462 family protein [Actinomycetota bacterium]
MTAIIRQEMDRRFEGSARIEYVNVQEEEIRSERGALIDEIEARGLLYPVTVIDGVPVYDGAVSYPAILRAVGDKLSSAESPASTA